MLAAGEDFLFYSAEAILTLGVYQVVRYRVHVHSFHYQYCSIFARQGVNVRSFKSNINFPWLKSLDQSSCKFDLISSSLWAVK
jgi:hypothetical protein